MTSFLFLFLSFFSSQPSRFCSSSSCLPAAATQRKKKGNPTMPWKIGKEAWYFPLPFLF
ncbi:hypothetical protein SLEP1_g26394 [Rubroshorea leprosula]|uniref:Secreted protein n=1 Tax=Rubroshorea leprosula TaxID=152421 RepID=A0AAV5JM30_9ROSI|nr:hypothetical protein SLEP1_g26394 [Rubroshorea leprosula]